MGTRGTIHILDGKKTLVSIYRQMDAYPTGLGKEIKSMLSLSKIINGYNSGDHAPYSFNGMGCLAAYLVGNLKLFKYGRASEPIGDVYITSKDDRQEYNYFLSKNKKDRLNIKVTDWEGKSIFDGDMVDFKPEDLGLE